MKWYPTTAEEMRAFVGVNVIMGIDQKPELCITTGLQMSSWGMWAYSMSSHEIILSHCADIST